jgi:acetylornithine deacetylase/succinyl-diaminopimelate desuccinylase-like protein
MPVTPRSPLARRRRASARIALYVSLVLTLASAWGLLAWLRPSLAFGGMTAWRQAELAGDPEVARLREYIAIDTSTPDGDQLAGALWWAEQVRAIGLEPMIERVGDEANAWAVLEGEVPEAVVLHHHIDVDPVPRPEDWVYDPYAGTIEGPWLYGRGAFDMKSVAVAQLAAVRALVETGRRPHRSVMLLATTGEEVGSDLGTRWVVREHPELVRRMAVVITEGGAVEGTEPGVVKHWGTEVAQTRLVRIAVCAGEREPLATLAADLMAHRLEGEPRMTDEVLAVLPRYAPTRDDPRLRAALGDPAQLLRDRESFRTLPSYLRSFFADELQVGPVGPAPGGGWELPLRILLLPGSRLDDAMAELLPPWLLHGVAVAVVEEPAAPHGSDPGHWAFATVDRLLSERHPRSTHGPLYLPLTLTDARFFRAADVPTFGFTPFNVLTPEVMQVRHGSRVNERISLDGFLDGVDLYRELLARLTADESSQQK